MSYVENGKFPDPSETVELLDENDKLLGEQGIFDEEVIKKGVDMTSTPKDPDTEEYYAYTRYKNSRGFEVGGFLNEDEEAIYSNKLYAVNKEPYIATYGNMNYCDGKFPNPLSMYDREEYKYINKILMGEGASLKFNLGKMVNLGRQIVKVGGQAEETCKNIAPVSCVDGNVDLESLSVAYPDLKGFFDNSEVCPIDAWECPYEDDICNQPDIFRFHNNTITTYMTGTDLYIDMNNRKGDKLYKSTVISTDNEIIDIQDLGNDWFNFTYKYGGNTYSKILKYGSGGFDWDGSSSKTLGGNISSYDGEILGGYYYETYIEGGKAYSRRGKIENGTESYEPPKQITPDRYNCKLPKLIDVYTNTYVVVYEKGGVTYVGGFRDEGDEIVELTSFQIGDGTDYNIEQLTEDIIAVAYKASAHMETFKIEGEEPDLTAKLDEYTSEETDVNKVFMYKVGSVYYALIIGRSSDTKIEITKVNKKDGKISLIKEYNNIPCKLNDVKRNGGNFSFVCDEGLLERSILPPTDEETTKLIETKKESICGDGFVDSGEQCDDGNTTDGDGCSLVCTLEGPKQKDIQGDISSGVSFLDGTYGTGCDSYLKNGSDDSGIYWIDVDGEFGKSAFKVYCDMESEGGGWTMILAQYENDPVTNWAEGIQNDYDPTLSTNKGFALDSGEIPEHNQIAFGKDKTATYVDYVDGTYTVGNISKTLLTSPSTGNSYHIHRDNYGFYASHDPENSFSSPSSIRKKTLTFDKIGGVMHSWSFSPHNLSKELRGYAMNGSYSGLYDSYAWTVWVRKSE